MWTDLAAVAAAVTPATRCIFTESVSNPTLAVADVPALAAIARARGVALVVDNTFAPMLLSPALLGADVVLHSLTKFVSGSSDVMGGAICGRAAFIASLLDRGPLMPLGPAMDPHHGLLRRLANPGGYGTGGLLAVDMGTPGAATSLMERLAHKHGFGLMVSSRRQLRNSADTGRVMREPAGWRRGCTW